MGKLVYELQTSFHPIPGGTRQMENYCHLYIPSIIQQGTISIHSIALLYCILKTQTDVEYTQMHVP